MLGDVEIDDPELSDGATNTGYSEHEHEPDVVDPEENDSNDMAEQKFKPEADENGKATGAPPTKPKYDPKDPLRPRRKKARRACFACQRAHLTCGDERPCQRCIKRGIAEACQDGVRKKAKYLHDAPPEALRPVLGPTFNQVNNRSNSGPSTTNTISETSPPVGSYFTQADASPSYPIYTSSQMPPPIQTMSYSAQQSPLSPGFQHPGIQQPESMPGLSVSQPPNDAHNPYGSAMFDPSNPALYSNFDLKSLRFDNHYGALEFSMLGHMSSGALPEPTDNSQMPQPNANELGFNNTTFGNDVGQYGPIYSQEMLPNFVAMDPQNSAGAIFPNAVHHGLPLAYAIGNGPASQTSPSTEESPAASGMGFESPTPYSSTNAPHRPLKVQDKQGSSSKFAPPSVLGKRSRDPASIYDTVHEPYPYTSGFHSLTAYLQRRFSPNKTLRIAKALGSIRPSFISCTKTLNRQDLIFMEKCFQRTLFAYDDIMHNCCTPTVVCRRTGEVAAVNKEFTLLTGWKKDVLLGYEANLNINTGKSSEEKRSGDSKGNLAPDAARVGLTTPRMRPLSSSEIQSKEGKPQPVFSAELMNDDSVMEFYDDFARLAFGDSRGSVMRRCKLLKYQTKEMNSEGPNTTDVTTSEKGKGNEISDGGIGGMGNRVREIDGEHGIGRLEKDGKLDCCYCWTVKRDVFDIPMLIVMNFLPCI